MTKSFPLAQIEQAIDHLSYDDRLLLIERLAHGLRQCSREDQSPMDRALAEMAADPEMRREIEQIEQEFSLAEPDGLEQL